MNEMRFDGRVAAVTGGGRGLGRAYAMLLAARGAKVVVNDPGASRTGEENESGVAQQLVDEIVAAGGDAAANTDTVATREGAEGIVGTALDRYGRLDILIHNATINRHRPFREMAFEDFAAVIDVHLHGGFHTARAAFPGMCDRGYGRIVFVSSICGLYGEHKVAGYNAGKAALIGLSHGIALEGAEHGVKSNVIIPAAETRLREGRDTSSFPPMGPELVAPAVGWLAHESCSVTGEMLVALAGRVAKAFVAETTGVHQPSWTIEQVAEQIDRIGDRSATEVFSPVPRGFYDHLNYSFEMGRSV